MTTLSPTIRLSMAVNRVAICTLILLLCSDEVLEYGCKIFQFILTFARALFFWARHTIITYNIRKGRNSLLIL